MSLCFSLSAQAELTIEQGSAGLAKKGTKLFFEHKPVTGTVVERWLGGHVFKSDHYKEGLLEGVSSKYALNGRLIERSNYRRGKKDQLQETWYEEGPKKSEKHFKRGLLDGVQTEWRLDGSVFRREVFVAGREVARKMLYQNGAIFTNYVKRDGRLYGQDGGKLCQEPLKREGEK